MKLKYVRLEKYGIIIFPRITNAMHEDIGIIHKDIQLIAEKKKDKIISAGFIDWNSGIELYETYGYSQSLNMKPLPDDNKLINDTIGPNDGGN